MTRIIYVYVDGSDNADNEAELLKAFSELKTRWFELGATLVNQKYEPCEGADVNDLSDWFIGLNIPLSSFGAQQIEHLVPLIQKLAKDMDRDFVVGVTLPSGMTQDLVFLDRCSGEREVAELNLIIQDAH
ncbi:hypothetical protein [Pseudomonas fulva]|nr:hypothetical protein [Pseudomonas fulva]